MRLTLAVMLKTAGHEVAADTPHVTISDNIEEAVKAAAFGPTLLLAAASDIKDAVKAMERGVFGYIFVPLQPGEAVLMVERAAGAAMAPPNVREADTTLSAVEREHILCVLRECKGNKVKTAARLGIGRNTLWRKLRQYRITEDEEE